MTVRTRFAPSPTGTLHIGSIRTALFCWLYARHCDGKFLVRIEDTDPERSTAENVEAIFDGLNWLGMVSDEEPIYQTDRFDRYNEVIQEWLSTGTAYRCYCTKEELEALRAKQRAAGEKTRYDGRCRSRTQHDPLISHVIRFRNPDTGSVIVDDLVRGKVIFDNAELDDLVIARSDGSPTYNFTVVVDDADMQISHVIRGDDHLNNTPRQMNMLDALGIDPPKYAHLPMILGEDGAKLSKRHGAVDIREYRRQGYLPEALLNYLVRLGWSHGDQEIFSITEMIQHFDIADVNQSASAFNPEKLRWLNQQHIISLPTEELGRQLIPFLRAADLDLSQGPSPEVVADAYRERSETLAEMAESCRYCFEDFPDFDAGAAKKQLRPVILEPLRSVTGRLKELDEWAPDKIAVCISESAETHNIKMGKLGQPIRVAVTGGPVSPPIDVTVALVGRERALQRLHSAIDFIEIRQAAAS